MDKLKLLLKEIDHGKDIVLIAGAGLSMQVVRADKTGLPGWPQLTAAMLDEMKEYLSVEEMQELNTFHQHKNYQKIADEFKKTTSRSIIFSRFLKRHLDPPNICGSTLHELILDVGFKGIITTNFDRVFERSRPSLEVLRFPEALGTQGNLADDFFIKIHGCIGNNDLVNNLVLSSDDYKKLEKNEAYTDKLKAQFENNIILCVGYSFADPDFLSITKHFKRVYGDNSRPPYVLMRNDYDPASVDADLEVIPYAHHDDIRGIMEQIRARFQSRPKSKVYTKSAQSESGSMHAPAEPVQMVTAEYPPFEIPVPLIFKAAEKEWKEATTSERLPLLARSINSLSDALNNPGKDLVTSESEAVKLETLYYFLTLEVRNKATYAPFKGLSDMRANAFACALIIEADLDDNSYDWIVRTITDNMPEDGCAVYLKAINAEVKCTKENRLYWAVIIGQMLARGMVLNDHAFDKEKFTALAIDGRYPETEADKTGLFNDFRSPEAIRRVHASFRILECAFRTKDELQEKISYFNEVLDMLAGMLQSNSNADKIAATFALRWIVKTGSNIPNGNRIRAYDRAILEKELFNDSNTGITLYNLIYTIACVFESPVTPAEDYKWTGFTGELSLVEVPLNACTPASPDLFNHLINIYKTRIRTDKYDYWHQIISICLLKLGLWVDEMADGLFTYIVNPDIGFRDINNILIRLAKVGPEKAAPLLLRIVKFAREDFSNDYRCMALLTLIETGKANELKEEDIAYTCKLADIDPAILLQEIKDGSSKN